MSRFTIGQYVIQGLLGSGGTGQVYSALDQDLGRLVALKALRPEFSDDPDLLERFRSEAANLARLNHPNITTLYSLHRETTAQRQSLFLVMEMVSGETLEAILVRSVRLPTPTCLAIARQAIAGLSYAHSVGIIHRDIKPSNIMLNEAGLLKIMDFGIARAQGSERLTRQGAVVGTLNYIAPEQIKGYESDERSDIYSLACVLYKLLSGKAPFSGLNEYDLIQAQLETAPEPLGTVLPELEPHIGDAIMRALAKNPDDRFASMDAFGEALGTVTSENAAIATVREQVVVMPPHPLVLSEQLHLSASEGSLGTSEAPTPSRTDEQPTQQHAPTPPATRRPTRAIAIAALILLAGGAVLAYTYTRPSAPPAPDQQATLAPTATPQNLAPQAPPAAPAPTPEPPLDLPPHQLAAAAPTTESRPLDPPASQALDAQADTTADQATPPPPTPAAAAKVEGKVASYSSEGWPIIDGTTLRLTGVDALNPAQVKRISDWVTNHGSYLACNAIQPDGYRCLTRQKFDLAQAILLNGAARASTDATPIYRAAEEAARAKKRGVWH